MVLAWKVCCAGAPATVIGILNGVDYEEWSPQTDKFTVAKYSPTDLSGESRSANRICWLHSVFRQPPTKLPVIGIVSRFAAQKGFDLISQVADRLAREEMVLIVARGRRQTL